MPSDKIEAAVERLLAVDHSRSHDADSELADTIRTELLAAERRGAAKERARLDANLEHSAKLSAERAAQYGERLASLREAIGGMQKQLIESREKARKAGRENVASHRQSDVETIERILELPQWGAPVPPPPPTTEQWKVSLVCSEGEHSTCTGCICGCHKDSTAQRARELQGRVERWIMDKAWQASATTVRMMNDVRDFLRSLAEGEK